MVAEAGRLGRVIDGGLVIYLLGDLGAGKTTFARALLRALGVDEHVRSPTYSIVESYELRGRQAHHMDLYRIADAEEIHWLGVDDLLDPGAIMLVEWPRKGAGMLPDADLVVHLRHAGEERELEIEAMTARGRAVMAGMPAA